MQIKLCYKMAKNDGSMVVYGNTIQENERILYESCCPHQVEAKSKEDFEKLFIKLNYVRQVRPAKEEVQLNPSWSNKNVINYTYGPVSGFLPGAWWGIRMDCSRDRVHDPFNENIQNGPFGVTSVCTSSTNLNEDVDFGSSLTVTGRRYLDGKCEKDPLIKNYESQIPLRLIRSYNLLNEFAPKTGYRYDGLYIVTNVWIGVNSDSTKHYKFALLRLNDQEPAVWSAKQTSLNASRTSSALHPMSTSLRNCSENLGSGIAVQKVKHEKSNGFVQLGNVENKQTDEKEKAAPESAIVTRHVFKKANTECTPIMPSMSATSENKSLTHIGAQGSKTHNTNISIRTGLYDSSYSTQHDVKKSTLLPFCRTAKSLNLAKANQHTEHSNPTSKDKNRGSDGKAQVVATNEFPKRVDYISPNTIKPDAVKVKSTKDTSIEASDATDDLNCSKTHKSITNDSKDVCKSNVNSSDTPTNVLNSTNSTNSAYRNENSTHKVASKETQELKSIDSLDALTPDTILHLINKKCHPLSKLLMGNMIGLTSEQSIDLKPHDLLTVQAEINNKVATQRNGSEETIEKKNFESIPDDLIGARCYKFRRRRRLSRKAMSKSEIRKCDKAHNGESRTSPVQSLDILGENLMAFSTCNGSEESISEEGALHSSKRNKDIKSKVVKENGMQAKKIDNRIKKDVGSRNEIRTRLRTMKAIKSSLKKHINKKQRREITNLLIDANIGPKVRGPRNRRLRCISNTYAKQSYKRYSNAMCIVNKCSMNSKILEQQSTFKARNKLAKSNNYKRVRDKESRDVPRSKALNLNETRIHKNLAVSKKVDKVDIAGRISNNNDNINNTSDNNKSVKVNLRRVQSNDVTMVENRKRKSIQTVPTKVKCSPRIEELHKRYKKEISQPCKTDAVIQCSLIREPLMRSLKSNDFVQNNARNEQYTFIKIEYGEFKDTKSVMSRATRSNGESKGADGGKRCTKAAGNIRHRKNSDISLNSNILITKEQSKCSAERMSAFVPVNVLDSDLKIARLRSIGFKPIVSCGGGGGSSSSNETAIYQNKGNCSATFNSKVLKQNVSEKYNQYTNEENDVVVYMDDELQYQDIEDEDNNSLANKRKTPESGVCVSSNEQINRITSERGSYNDPLWEQDLESPWHGWKKVVTSEDTYWIGW